MNISSMLSPNSGNTPMNGENGETETTKNQEIIESPNKDNTEAIAQDDEVGKQTQKEQADESKVDILRTFIPRNGLPPIMKENEETEEEWQVREDKMEEQKYLKDFEDRVNKIQQLDRTLIKHNMHSLIKVEESNLNAVIRKTSEIAGNYLDRVVTEDITSEELLLKSGTDRRFRWGSTREGKKYGDFKEADGKMNGLDENKGVKTKNQEGMEETKGGANAKNTKAKPKRKPTPSSHVPDADAGRGKRRKTRAGTQAVVEENWEESSADLGENNEEAGNKNSAKEQRIASKQYENIFVAIWKDLSRKDGPKVSRMLQQSSQAKMLNMKKTSILAAREARRWQLKNNKNQKDLTAKARRAMREMFNFWKRNERIERELRRKHEKELLDKAKKEEEERESKRQSRKLNFLITQTELYSHFIGNKIKTRDFEGGDADPNVNFEHEAKPHTELVGDDENRASQEYHSIDFDIDDDDAMNKAAANNAQMALEAARNKAQSFDVNPETNGEEMNFQNPALMGNMNITQPDMLKCDLKEYQLKGLNWLGNLYEQGINGILADEMGLGKTVQSISVLAYLAEKHDIWGPFLIVTPSSTLHNWQQEITRFVPDFKVIPYWGSAKDRKVLRKFWDRKNVRYTRNAPFHVLVTSYQLIVTDTPYFQKMRWQYMILDEAQAIKSSLSSRWKSLLSFSCRNRLLLTGTPIQNSMQELWALLHFIMPSLFDSHDEFSDWFSKDIESHAQSNTKLNEQQLKRLHVILKPFMLRRVKKNVQSELGDKVEVDLFCDLTNRQKKYYQMLKSQISVMDLLDASGTGNDDQSLMNLVMQFRKVCNHPDLFERADVESSYAFSNFAETGSFLREGNDLDVNYTTENLLKYHLPKLIYRELLRPGEENDKGSKDKILHSLFNIYDPMNTVEDKLDNFGWLNFVNTSPQELKNMSRKNVIERAIDLKQYSNINYEGSSRFKYLYDEDDNYYLPRNRLFLVSDYESGQAELSNSPHLKELHTVRDKVYEDMMMSSLKPAAAPIASAPPVTLVCHDRSISYTLEDVLFNRYIKSSMMPLTLDTELNLIKEDVPVPRYPKSNLYPLSINKFIDYSNIRMPSMTRFITESGKLSKLDELLTNLKQNDHRVLIYFQMTKMMDLMEEYLTHRQHAYIRLDGSSKLDDRRDLVHDWQTKPEIFVFLLSTRAGGLGINLTAADTVIFYDSDWNPTIDSQAMDRAHRLGQTRQVTVYRLLAKGTIEERMRDRAKQKEQVQHVVMEGKAAQANKDDNTNKKKDVAFLLLGGGDEGNAPSASPKEQ